jgi:hypothetical protein
VCLCVCVLSFVLLFCLFFFFFSLDKKYDFYLKDDKKCMYKEGIIQG